MSEFCLDSYVKLEDLFHKKPVGWSITNHYTRITRGFRRKEVHLFVAPSGVGKTRTGVGVACKLLQQGLKVVYLTFEQEEVDIAELVVAGFGGSREEPKWDLVGKQKLRIERFEPDSEEHMINMFGCWKGADAVIIDYLTVPYTCGLEGGETSGTLMRMMQAIHKAAEENNQFIFCMMQGKPREKGSTQFCDSSFIWGSRQVVNAAEVVVIAQRTDVKNQLDLDFIKVRYGNLGTNLRIKWDFDYEHCSFEDIGPIWYSDTMEEVSE